MKNYGILSAKQGRRDGAFLCRARQPECPLATGSPGAGRPGARRRHGPTLQPRLNLLAGAVGSAQLAEPAPPAAAAALCQHSAWDTQ